MKPDRYADARALMVDEQLSRRGITDRRVLNAMMAVPRHAFVPPEQLIHAYEDRALPIGTSQTISQPFIVALMTQLLAVQPGDTILEVGTGSGYQCAVLAMLTRRVLAMLTRRVVTIERHQALSDNARRVLDAIELTNVTYIVGDGTLGWPANAPYDGIVVTAAAPQVPEALLKQLAVGGRMVIPVGGREEQMIWVIHRTPTGFEERAGIGCRFVPLVGKEGWRIE